MGTDVQPPSGQSTKDPRANRFFRGPDAGLYFIGVIAVLAFISMIAVLFWVASRENTAQVAALPTSSLLSVTEEGVVLLPIVSGKSTADAQGDLTNPTELPSQSTPLSAADLTSTSQAANAPELLPTIASPFPSSVTASQGQNNTTPNASGSSRSATPSPTLGATRTPTVTGNIANETPTPTTTGEVGTLFIRNDQGCVDPVTNDLYVFGEIVNNSTVPVDILNWDVKIYDGSREIQTDDIFLDIPNNYAVFANSSIPFALLTTLDRPNFTDYDISLDYAAGPHTPRSDLSIVEFTSTRDAGFTEVTGVWSHTDVANPPDIVWIIATSRDAQGKFTNLQYQHYTNASIIDPRLPSGQHSFRQLYLEDNPCGGGTIAVSILGE
jgi:hypothetical protein